MTQLVAQKCVACRRDSPHVTPDEIVELHPQVPEWSITDEDGIPKLQRTYRLANFQQALDFTNAVGAAAEEEDHHPRLVTEWGKVAVTWWTHKIKNIHRNDFIMAAKTDQIYSRFAPES